MKILVPYFAYVFIFILFQSCSSKLTRDTAKNRIIEYYNLPNEEYEDFEFTRTENVDYTIPFHYYPEYKVNTTSWGYKSQVEDTDKRDKAKSEAFNNAKFTNPPKSGMFEKLEKAGLMNYTILVKDVKGNSGYAGYAYEGDFSTKFIKVYTDIHCSGTAYHTVEPTEEGLKYIKGNRIRTSTLEFGEITGIVERKELNIAEVNYTLRRINITPFGSMIYNAKEEIIARTISFTKYDDGWRIQ